MRKIICLIILGCISSFAFAQTNQTDSSGKAGKPIDPVTNQFQNGNQRGWESANMNQVEAKSLPPEVSNSFNKDYPNQRDVTWYSYESGYTATYKDKDNMWQRSMYETNGKMVASAKQMNLAQAPETITSYIKKNYPKENNAIIYEVTPAKGNKSYVVYADNQWWQLDSKGNLIPQK